MWSCGTILFIQLSGYPPFNGPNDTEILKKVRSGKFSFSHKVWKKISPQAKDLISKMLTINYNERISAQQALKHDWMINANANEELDEEVIMGMAQFSAKNHMALLELKINGVDHKLIFDINPFMDFFIYHYLYRNVLFIEVFKYPNKQN